MKTPGTSYLRLRYAIVPAMLMASFAAAGQAEAACDPATSAANPLINTTVTCTGATAGQNSTTGYGVKEDKGNTINVLSGASVNGTNFGIDINNVSFADPETINNSGTISGASGISGGFGNVNNNAGATISGSVLFGIEILATGVVTNSGGISGLRSGAKLQNGEVTNTETGTITGVTNGVEIVSDAKVSNAGTISGGVRGISIGVASAHNAEIANSGTITSGLNGIESLRTLDLINSGTITGAGAGGGNGIVSTSANVINTGAISGAADAIQVTTTATVNNAGKISGSAGIAINADIATVTNASSGVILGGFAGVEATTTATVNNAGKISGGAGSAINADTADVTNSGIISGGQSGIFATTMATVRNSGAISSTGTISDGIQGGSVNVTNSGFISAAGLGIGIDAFNSAIVFNSGTITGGVGIRAAGAGTVTTSGTVTGTSGTAIVFDAAAGNTLTLAPGFVINGNVTNAAADITNTLQLGGSGNGTFDVSAIGTQYRNFGSFNKVDTSVFALTGTSTFAGPVNVNGGTLAVNGNTTSFGSLSVNAGGTLGGNGIVGNTTINGGVLAPGDPATGNLVGPLTVQGTLSFTAASTYMIQVSPTNAGRTNVTGVATLGGATVNAVFAPGGNVIKQVTILNATGGVSGNFNPLVSSNIANIQSTLSYDANDVFLNSNLVFVSPNGLNTNQQNVANALSGFFNSTGSIPAVFAALGPGGLTQASGEAATGSQQTTFNAMNQFIGLVTDPFIAGRGDGVASSGGAPQFAEANGYAANGKPRSADARDAYAAIYRKAPAAEAFAQRWSVWAAGYGGSQTTDGNAALGSNTATSRVYGTAVGADYRFSPFTLAGFALAGGGTNFSVANALGGGRSDLFQTGAFVRHTVGPAYISAALAYGWHDITTDRTVTIAGVDQLRAKFNANAWSGRVEGGYRFVTQGFGLIPYAAGQFTTFDLPAYAETAVTGANTFALAYAAKSVAATRGEIGLRSDKSFAMQDAILTLRGRAAWAHDFNPDRNIAATFQTLPGASFVVNGAAQSPDAALATASAEMKWLNGLSLAATFEGEFSNVTRSYAGKGVARYAW